MDVVLLMLAFVTVVGSGSVVDGTVMLLGASRFKHGYDNFIRWHHF